MKTEVCEHPMTNARTAEKVISCNASPTIDPVPMSDLTRNIGYQDLLERISSTYTKGRDTALQAVNSTLVDTYWRVGQWVVEFEQGGKERAEYGKGLIKQLSVDLRLRHGKGFSRANLISMRQFYLLYPKARSLLAF